MEINDIVEIEGLKYSVSSLIWCNELGAKWSEYKLKEIIKPIFKNLDGVIDLNNSKNEIQIVEEKIPDIKYLQIRDAKRFFYEKLEENIQEDLEKLREGNMYIEQKEGDFEFNLYSSIGYSEFSFEDKIILERIIQGKKESYIGYFIEDYTIQNKKAKRKTNPILDSILTSILISLIYKMIKFLFSN